MSCLALRAVEHIKSGGKPVLSTCNHIDKFSSGDHPDPGFLECQALFGRTGSQGLIWQKILEQLTQDNHN